MFSVEFGRTPPTYTRFEMPASGPPTWPSAPATPGMVWHPVQPYRRKIDGARELSPVVKEEATSTSLCRVDMAFDARNTPRTETAAAAPYKSPKRRRRTEMLDMPCLSLT